MRVAIAFVVLALLGACGTTDAERLQTEKQIRYQQQAAEIIDDARCRSYGAPPGTDRYIACRMNTASLRDQVGTEMQTGAMGRE